MHFDLIFSTYDGFIGRLLHCKLRSIYDNKMGEKKKQKQEMH